MMPLSLKHLLVFLLVALPLQVCNGADLNKPEEAVAMVKKAIEHYKRFGKSKTLEQVSRLKGPFVDKEMFTVVMDEQGVVLAHGFEHKMIGKNISEMRDHEGTAMVQDMFRITKNGGAGWTHYMFPNPMTRKIEPKSTYVEKYDKLIFFCGFHTYRARSEIEKFK